MTVRLGLAILGAILLVAGPAIAQRRGSIGPTNGSFASRSPSAASGFGSILYPGTGGPPPARRHTSFPQRLSATVSGYYGNLHVGTAGLGRNLTGVRPNIRPRHVGHRPVIYPVAYPVYYGGYNYAPPQPQQVHVTVQNVAPPQPPVIINQYYQPPNAKPVLRDYTNGELPETPDRGMTHFQAPIPSHPVPTTVENADTVESQATIYLIAYKDQTTFPAVGFWVEEGTLHYLTTQGSHNKASLELIDEAFSRQLNQERGIEFQLEVQ
jgi:hypothetical protein